MTFYLAVIFLFSVSTYSLTAVPASSSNKTLGQLVDESMMNFRENIMTRMSESSKKYATLKKDIADLEKFHVFCKPCKPSATGSGVCDCTAVKPMRDCLEFHQNGYKVDGVYRLQGPGFFTLTVYCDQTTQGGGWTVFQRRKDGSVDFHRNWNDYKNGFGQVEGEFWLGNENIHQLTKPSVATKKSQLMINMQMSGEQSNKKVYFKYNTFEITDENNKYALKINGPSGTAPTIPACLITTIIASFRLLTLTMM